MNGSTRVPGAVRALAIGALCIVPLATGCGSKGGESHPAPVAPRPCQSGGGYPTPACTGVPPGTRLTEQPLNYDGAFRVNTPGAVVDGKYIRGDLLITTDDVTIKNSQIDGIVINEYGPKHYPFTITDSTVGPADGCVSLPGIGESNYTATRVLVRAHGDGFRASGNAINIQDSYIHLCSNPGDHSDGIQTYLSGNGLTLNHTTIDQRDAKDITAPIFLSNTGNVVLTNNLVMGGTYSIQLKNVSGKAVVRNNRLVDQSWEYGSVEADCDDINWSGNELVRINDDYEITSVVGPLDCQK